MSCWRFLKLRPFQIIANPPKCIRAPPNTQNIHRLSQTEVYYNDTWRQASTHNRKAEGQNGTLASKDCRESSLDKYQKESGPFREPAPTSPEKEQGNDVYTVQPYNIYKARLVTSDQALSVIIRDMTRPARPFHRHPTPVTIFIFSSIHLDLTRKLLQS